MQKLRQYDVSVIVAQYNPSQPMVIKTIKSIIGQKKVKIQIIIADDGSSLDYFNETEKYLIECGFKDYKFSKCEKNSGTCINVKKAVECADGEYVKLISPGDYLFDQDTLYNWYTFCKRYEVKVSYGMATYYYMKDADMQVVKKKCAQPALNYLYKLENNNSVGKIIDNIVLCDCILGASFLCERKILEEYLKEICGKVKYCEDFSYRLMLLDGQRIVWYDKPTVYYSYGDGISSKSDSNGNLLLRQDEVAFDELLSVRKVTSNIGKRVQRFAKRKNRNRIRNRIISFIYFPEAVYYRLAKFFLIKMGKTETCKSVDEKFIRLIQSEGIEVKCK